MSGGGEREAPAAQAVGVGIQNGQANLYKVK